MITEKQFEEFIKKLKELLRGYTPNYDFVCEEIDNLYKKYSKDDSPQSGFEPVKGEWNNSPEDTQKDNHSPQEISSNKDFSQQNRRFIEPEDTSKKGCGKLVLTSRVDKNDGVNCGDYKINVYDGEKELILCDECSKKGERR